jgi:hypothetical protein
MFVAIWIIFESFLKVSFCKSDINGYIYGHAQYTNDHYHR